MKKKSLFKGGFPQPFGCYIYVLPNNVTIIFKNKDISARTVERRITDVAENVKHQQTLALEGASVFSNALYESVDINNTPQQWLQDTATVPSRPAPWIRHSLPLCFPPVIVQVCSSLPHPL